MTETGNSSHSNKKRLPRTFEDASKLFYERLPIRVDQLKSTWGMARNAAPIDPGLLRVLHHKSSSLVGSCATFGASAILVVAEQLERTSSQVIDQQSVMNKTLIDCVNNWVAELIHLCDGEGIHADQSDVSHIQSVIGDATKVVYLWDAQRYHLEALFQNILSYHANTKMFDDLSLLSDQCRRELPVLIIMYAASVEDINDLNAVLGGMVSDESLRPRMVVISDEQGIDIKLSAVRMGVARFLTPPLDTIRMKAIIEGFCYAGTIRTFNILVVDDDAAIGSYYAAVLEHHGMHVEIVQNPMETLTILDTCFPDLILMDLYMPECNGMELASIIRQDDKYVHMPIIYLSTEKSIDRKLSAMAMGGDDFITKPVTPERLILSVDTRVRRSRWLTRIHGDLEALLSLNERQREQLRFSKESAEQANQAKSEFLSSMSHELRTPLNAILGFAQILQMENEKHLLSDVDKDNVNEILMAGHHLLDIINDILDLAKIEAGHIELQLRDVSLNDVIATCITMNQPMAAKRKISLINQTSSDVNTSICADIRSITQVILNLLSNAIKYNHEQGEVIISYQHHIDGYIRVLVDDTGPGIDDEYLDKVFEPFIRALSCGEVSGSGIGLVISKKMIEAMGGAIGFESTKGEGSSFWVDVPLSIDDGSEIGC